MDFAHSMQRWLGGKIGQLVKGEKNLKKRGGGVKRRQTNL